MMLEYAHTTFAAKILAPEMFKTLVNRLGYFLCGVTVIFNVPWRLGRGTLAKPGYPQKWPKKMFSVFAETNIYNVV